MHEYGDDFYAFLSSFAVRSAQTVVPIVLAATAASSVADFGCGQGAWLSVWKSAGLDVQGVDGPYVDPNRLLIPQTQFTPLDLGQRINLGRRFDLVQSLETAEHLPRSSAAGFVATLADHSDTVLFSAAVPGQGGEHHINERSLEYWRGLFRTQGFVAIDLVRPAVRDNIDVQIWYRCNTILYVRSSALPSISQAARAFVVPDGTTLANYWPLRDRLVQAVIRQLPVTIVDQLSRVNARRYNRKEAVLF
jgi:hypothetical protein